MPWGSKSQGPLQRCQDATSPMNMLGTWGWPLEVRSIWLGILYLEGDPWKFSIGQPYKFRTASRFHQSPNPESCYLSKFLSTLWLQNLFLYFHQIHDLEFGYHFTKQPPISRMRSSLLTLLLTSPTPRMYLSQSVGGLQGPLWLWWLVASNTKDM